MPVKLNGPSDNQKEIMINARQRVGLHRADPLTMVSFHRAETLSE